MTLSKFGSVMWAVKAEKMTRFLHTSKPSGYVIPEIETALSGKKKPSSMLCCLSTSQRHRDYGKTLDFPD